MKNISLVIFDMDGLMIDSERVSMNAWLQVGKELNYDIHKDMIAKMRGMTILSIRSGLERETGSPALADKMIKRHYEIMDEMFDRDGVAVKPGLTDLLAYLDSHSIKKIVATSSARMRASRRLKLAGIYGRFDSMIFGDEVTKGKPDPEIFLKACKKMNVPKEEAIVLEDSENGLMAAHRGSIKCIVIPDLKYPSEKYVPFAEKIYDNLGQVIDYIED